MSAIEELLEANKGYAQSTQDGGRPMPPARHVASVACMDAPPAPREVPLADMGDAGSIDFLPFSDNEAAVRDDVEKSRGSQFIPDGASGSGYIYDVNTGQLATVLSAGT